jgi:hypothetical protein
MKLPSKHSLKQHYLPHNKHFYISRNIVACDCHLQLVFNRKVTFVIKLVVVANDKLHAKTNYM